MIEDIKKIAKVKGYKITYAPNKLNIWGFRSPIAKANSFDDQIHVFVNIGTKDKPEFKYYIFPCTTDPGLFHLQNPGLKGTAILKAGQYLNTYALALHQGKYLALCQRLGEVTVKRDKDKDNELDFDAPKTAKGFFGINIHRASKKGSTLTVDKYSAGCQVFKNAKDFEFFIKLCKIHKALHGNKFSYTLIDLKEDKENGRDYSKAAASDTSKYAYSNTTAWVWDAFQVGSYVPSGTYLGVVVKESNGIVTFTDYQGKTFFVQSNQIQLK